MKKMYILIAIAIVGILGWSATVNANENIIDLMTIEYSNIHEQAKEIYIDSNESINLTYISSDINESSLYIFNYFFIPSENRTRYVFATRQIEVDWQFVNDTKRFIYQDNNSKQLYSINVDYSAIDVPSDPLIEWETNYSILSNSFNELQRAFRDTLNELNESIQKIQDTWEFYNQSKDEFNNNSILVETLRTELEELDIKYNDTKKLWISATANASTYESYYRNLYDNYEVLQQEHNDLSGIYPVYLFFAILGTGMIAIVFFKRKKILGHEEKTDTEIEISTGYSPEAKRIDKFTSETIDKTEPEQKKDISEPKKEKIANSPGEIAQEESKPQGDNQK